MSEQLKAPEQLKVSDELVIITYYNATRPLPEGAKVAERIPPPPHPQQPTEDQAPPKIHGKSAKEMAS